MSSPSTSHQPEAPGWHTAQSPALHISPKAHGTNDFPQVKTATVIGITVAIAGNVLISLALNLQKLAHKRLERANIEKTRIKLAKGQQKDNRPRIGPANGGAGGRHSEGPSLDETDEDLERTRTDPLEDDVFQAKPSLSTVETQPLMQFPQTGQSRMNYGAGSDGGGSQAGDAQPQSSSRKKEKRKFLSRLVPLRFQSKRGRNGGASEATTLLPVDMLTEEAALNGRANGGTRNPENGDLVEEHKGSESDYLKSKMWWLGFLLMNIGEIGNFISYAWAPASVVAPLGTFALMANCLFAPLMLGENFRKRDLLGIIIAIIGAVTVVLASNASDTRLDPDGLLGAISKPPFIAYSCVYVVGAVVLALLSEGSIGRQWVFVDVGLCALFGGFTVLSTKALSTLLTMEWIEMFTKWITYPTILVLIFTGVGQIRYLNRALMRFDSKVVIPIQFVFFNLSAIVGSAILYGDFERAKFHQIVTFLYGCAATFGGVFIIAWAPSRDRNDDDDYPEAGRMEGESESGITGAEGAVSGTEAEERLRPGFGSFGRRRRVTLVLPSGVSASPNLRHQQSAVSLIGLSPAQHLLLVHTPPRDVPDFRMRDWARDRDWDVEQDVLPTPDSSHRRRTTSWYGEETRNGGSGSGARDSSTARRLRNMGGPRNDGVGNVVEGQNTYR